MTIYMLTNEAVIQISMLTRWEKVLDTDERYNGKPQDKIRAASNTVN
jgi:hypothetical protein